MEPKFKVKIFEGSAHFVEGKINEWLEKDELTGVEKILQSKQGDYYICISIFYYPKK
jgi:hypothetical protein